MGNGIRNRHLCRESAFILKIKCTGISLYCWNDSCMILIWRQSFLQNTCTDILKVWRCEWIHRSQNLNKTLLLLVTARLLARLNNTNGWSPVTLLDTTSLSTQSQLDGWQLDGWLAGRQLPWSPLGCWCHVRAKPFCSLGQMLHPCHVLLPEAGLSMEVPCLHRRTHLSCCEHGAWGWWAMSWSLCWAFMTQDFYDFRILFGQNHPPSWMQLSQIIGV